jgi:hypothetical protein
MTTTDLACLSDHDQLLAQLAAQIRNRHRSHIRELWIEVVWGGVVLHGQASNFYGKQMAFHEVCNDGRFVVVANQIEVQSRDDSVLNQ